jgi:arylsulfatase A-like enzyme
MTRLAMVLAALLGSAGCNWSSPPAAPPPRPAWQPKPLDVTRLPLAHPGCNLVLISFDALQAAHVGCLGYERDVTPNLDRFATESFTFTRNYSAASWTVPSTMTWFTGVYPSEHGLTNKFAVYTRERQQPAKLSELAPELTTLAEILRGQGYATGGFTGNAGVSGAFGFDQGFDTYFHEPQRFGSFATSIPRALDWLRQQRGRKFFLFLHGYDVHGQSAPAGGFDYRFVNPEYDRKFSGSPQEQELLREEGLSAGKLELRDADVRFWRAIYDEKIQRTDERFGRFLAEFERLGLAGNTLIVITSDHGTEFYEHRRFDHGFTLYDEQIRVPLFVKLPGQAGGAVIEDRVSSVDLLPTILELLGVEVAGELQSQLRGQSLVPALRGQHEPRDVISETDYRQYTYQRSLIAPDGWKLICTLENSRRELFDLNADPGETNNLAQTHPQIADALQQRLFEHYRALGHDLTARQWEVGLNPVYESQAQEPAK